MVLTEGEECSKPYDRSAPIVRRVQSSGLLALYLISSYSWSLNGEKKAFEAVHYHGELDIYVSMLTAPVRPTLPLPRPS